MRYCTYFDGKFLARGVTMLRSLCRWAPGAWITVLALDDLCAEVVKDIFGDRIDVLRQADLLAADPELAACRSTRAAWPFYATHKPVFLHRLLQAEPRGGTVAFVDADTWFFSSPWPMLVEGRGASIGLSPHRFSQGNEHLDVHGTYNAGFVYLAVDETAIQCMADWRADCLAWCADEVLPDGRFMNQGYLNQWPQRYAGVRVIGHPGSNLAPWNINGHCIARGRDRVLVDGEPLIFYHFSQLHSDGQGNWYSLRNYFDKQFDLVVEAIYAPYAAAVERERGYLARTYGVQSEGNVRALPLGTEAVRVYPAVGGTTLSEATLSEATLSEASQPG